MLAGRHKPGLVRLESSERAAARAVANFGAAPQTVLPLVSA